MRITDHTIGTPKGQLFARSWMPDGETAQHAAAILLIHDSLGAVELWREFPRQLSIATGRRVVAYDRLGFGHSSPYPGQLPADFIQAEAADYLPALCEQLGINAFIPFGHSVGGGMAVAAAATLPQRCPAVVTVAAQAFVEELTLAGIRATRDAFQAPGQMERLSRYHGDKAPWVLNAWTETWLAPDFADWTLTAALAQIHCPLLALHGDRDEYGSRRHPERIATSTKGPAEMMLIENCGHVPHREQPTRLLDAVAPFLAKQA